MRLSVYPLPALVPAGTAGPAVVIDVLRATSVMVTALAHGARAIQAVAEVHEAREAAAQYPAGTVLLGGERRALPIPGFDLSNSPREYTPEKVAGKTLILTTTNGTRALASLQGVEPLFIGAVLNAGAVARTLAHLGRDALLVCSGTRGRFSLDDVACAGLIAARLKALVPALGLDDLAYAALSLYENHCRGLKELVAHAVHYRYLVELGLERDIDFCLKEDLFTIVPEVQNGLVTVGGR